jgi:tetratricopeptide (TPR) repeat protein
MYEMKRAFLAPLILATLLAAEPLGNFRQGELLYSQGKFAVATDFLLAAVKESPLNADAWFYLGNLHTMASNFLEADKAFQKAMELRPESADIVLGYGGLKRLQKQNDVAEALFQKALKLSASSAPAHEQLAKLYFDVFEWAKSADRLEAVLTLRPEHPQRATLENLIRKLRAGKEYAEQKKKELAAGGKADDKPPPFTLDLKNTGKASELKTRSEGSVDAKKPEADIVD